MSLCPASSPQDALALKQVGEDAFQRLQQGWQEQAPSASVGRGPGRPRGKTGSASHPVSETSGSGGGAIEMSPVKILLNAVKGTRVSERGRGERERGGGERGREGGEDQVSECVRCVLLQVPPGRLLWLTFKQLPPQGVSVSTLPSPF